MSYRARQSKVGVLPVDCIRLSQALEWRPAGGVSTGVAAPPVAAPNKALLTRCTATHVSAALAATLDALPSGKLLLVYVSGDRPAASTATDPRGERAPDDAMLDDLAARGVLLFPSPRQAPQREQADASGSVRDGVGEDGTAGRVHQHEDTAQVADDLRAVSMSRMGPSATQEREDAESTATPLPEASGDALKEQSAGLEPSRSSGAAASASVASPRGQVLSTQQLLLPEDLRGLTRKRLLLIVDSDNANAFAAVAKQPLAHPPLLLLSPRHIRARRGIANEVRVPTTWRSLLCSAYEGVICCWHRRCCDSSKRTG